MKLPFAARLSRPDVTVAITRLASKASSWNTSHDRALKRLMRYVATKPDLRLHSTLSTEDFADAQLVMSPDADLAGDLETTKSTTGMFLELQPKDGARSWPLSWRTKRQGSTATSTCEAEYVTMSTSARTEAIPMQASSKTHLGDALTWCAWKTTLNVLAPSSPGTRLPCARSLARSASRCPWRMKPSCSRQEMRSVTSRRTRTRATSPRSEWSRPNSRQRSTCWVCDANEATGTAASRAAVDLTDLIMNIYSYLLDLVCTTCLS